MVVFATTSFLSHPHTRDDVMEKAGPGKEVSSCTDVNPMTPQREGAVTRKAGISYNEKYVGWKVESWNGEILGKQ